MNNLILRSPQSWQTSSCLPFVQITGTVVEWDVRAKQFEPSAHDDLHGSEPCVLRVFRRSTSTSAFCNVFRMVRLPRAAGCAQT